MPNTITWEQRKLGDICNITTGKLDANAMVENGKYDFFTSGIKKYKIDHYAFLGPALTIAGNGATVGYMHYADGFFNAYQRTYVLTELLGDRTFLFSTINRKLQKKIQQEARAGNIPYIVLDMLTELDIYLPSLEEQTQIGNFFKQLDDTIALHQRELEKFKILKTSYLENIFLDKVSLFTAKNTITWEQRKLGDVVEIIGGGTPDTNNTAYWNGNIDWYSPTEIGNKPYVSGSLKKISVLGLQKSSAKILPANKTILFTSRAGIGDMAILTKQGTTNQGFQSFILKNDVDIYFLYSMGFKIKDFALKNASGSTFLEISKSQLSQMKLYLPSLKEQTQIGNFFKQLDDTIALHQKELAKYQQIKTACLEKMFVE